MKIAIVKEKIAAEKRVAASPETVKKLLALGAQVFVETGAGVTAAITDEMYRAAGAQVVSLDVAYGNTDVFLRVRHPSSDELKKMKKGALVIGILSPYQEKELVKAYAAQGVTAMAMELVPRITRARARWPVADNSGGFESARCNSAASTSAESSAARKPSLPLVMTSALPQAVCARQGTPQAIASSTALDKPSKMDGAASRSSA